MKLRLPLLAVILLLGFVFWPQGPKDRVSVASSPLGVESGDRFGIDFVNGAGYNISDTRYQQAVQAGTKWTRWPIYWHEIETSPGRLDDVAFAAQDDVVRRDRANGLRINAILLGTPGWASTSGSPAVPFPKIGSRGEAVLHDGALSSAISKPANLYTPVFNPDGSINQSNYWARFVYTTVSRYRDRIKVWEMWNEPDLWEGGVPVFWAGSREDYYQLLKVGYLAAKAADPSSTVLMSGLAYWSDKEFFPRILDMMAADSTARNNNYYFDVIPWHLYVSPYYLYTFANFSRDQMGRRGISKPVWVNETNLPVCDDRAVDTSLFCPSRWRGTMEDQAGFVIKAYAMGAASAVERVFAFQFYDDDVGPHDWYGLVRNDGTVRPAYNSYKVAARYLADITSGTYTNDGQAQIVTLTSPSQGKVTVVWNGGPNALTGRIRATMPEATLVNKYGVEQPIFPDGDNYYSISLPGATYYDSITATYDVGGDPYLMIEAIYGRLSSRVNPLPTYSSGRSFNVSWSRLDSSSEAVTYDVQFKDGVDGAWTNWLENTTATSATFGPNSPVNVAEGHTYYFRSRAKSSSSVEPYPAGNGDAYIIVPYLVTGQILNNRGIPIFGARIEASATSFSTTSSVNGGYSLGIVPSGTYNIAASKSGYGSLPPKSMGITASLIYDFVLPPSLDAMTNGGFEQQLNGWATGGTALAKTFRHTGDWGAYLADSGTLSQVVTVPGSTNAPTMSFIYRSPANSARGELRVSAVGNAGTRGQTIQLAAEDTWKHSWIDLGSLGDRIEIKFEIAGESSIVWLDEVSVGAYQEDNVNRFYLPIITKGFSR